jgi:DNA-binding transcriptional regulator LsrR (DeoR family)
MAEPFNKNEYIKIAYYYYKNNMTQNEIAKRMSMSRQRVNRILKKCLDTGIVKIVIQEYENHNVEFETQLEARLGLNEVIIADSRENHVNETIGEAGSSYLARVIRDNDVIGFSRGRALSSLVASLVPADRKNLTVTQLVGGLNAQEAHINSDDIVRQSAEVLNAKPYFMYAPIIVENRQLRDSMLAESFFSQVYNTMKKCTVAVVGIGDMSTQSSFVQRTFMSEEEYSVLRSKNAVGEICTHYFNGKGKIVESGINDRVFAIDYASYKKIPLRIGVAGGREKISAIKGAVKGKLINVLITDYDTAKALL